MVEEIMQEAMIFHGPGGCPNCGDLLTVIDHEMTIMELNREGHPLTEETVIRVRACCRKCGHKQDMMRWNGTYIPYSEMSKMIRIGELKASAEKRNSELRKQTKGKNPFLLE